MKEEFKKVENESLTETSLQYAEARFGMLIAGLPTALVLYQFGVQIELAIFISSLVGIVFWAYCFWSDESQNDNS